MKFDFVKSAISIAVYECVYAVVEFNFDLFQWSEERIFWKIT